MRYESTLIAVRDLPRSLRFYRELLDMEVTEDFGANVTLSDRLSLQTLDTWQGFLGKQASDIRMGGNAAELYFEEDDFDSFQARLAAWPEVELVTPVMEQSWGQRTVRFYDPDRNIIEVGENLVSVVRRFLDAGMTPEEAAVRMDVSLDYIRACMACG